MPNINKQKDITAQTEEKLNTLESLLRLATEDPIPIEENDIYIYLANLRRLEERIREEELKSKKEKIRIREEELKSKKEKTSLFQKIHMVKQEIKQWNTPSSNTKKSPIEPAKSPIEPAKSLIEDAKKLAAKSLPTPEELRANGVTEKALQESITALFETSKAKKIKGLHTKITELKEKITELKEKITLEKDQQEKGRIHDEKKAVSASIKKENASKTIDLEIEDVSKTIDLEIEDASKTIDLEIKEARNKLQKLNEIHDKIIAVSESIEKENARKTIGLEIEEARTNLLKLNEIHDEIKTVSASIKKENASKKIDLEIKEARANLEQLRKLKLKEAINTKKSELKQDPFFRYKFAMTYCKTEKEEEALKSIGIKLLSNPKDEEELNEFEEQLAANFKEQLAAKKETAIPLHNQKKNVRPTQKEIYANTLANAAEKEAKVIASKSLPDKSQRRKFGMSDFVPTAWETIDPKESFTKFSFNMLPNSANEQYHRLFEQTHIMHDLFKKMNANLTAHKPNYEEYAMDFFREDTQNLQNELQSEFENAHRQKLSSLKRTQSIAIQQLKRKLTEEVKEDLALFEKVGIGSKLAAKINNIENHEGYEAFCGDYEATKENLSTRRKKQKEAFFPNKTTIEDKEGVKEAINALQPVQGLLTGASIVPRIVMMYRIISPSKNETIEEELLTKINNMQSNDWKNELRSPELLLQIGDNPDLINAYKAAMILHCDAVIEILKEQESDIPPNYKTFLNDYFPLLPGEKLIQFFDLASPHLEGGTKIIVMDDIESHLASKSANYLEKLLKKTINVTLFDKIKNTLLKKTVDEKAPEEAQRTILYSNIEEQLTALNSTQLSAEIKFLIEQLDALIANAPDNSPESIQKDQKALFAELNALVDIKFIENRVTGKRRVYTDAKNNLKSIIEQKIITPHINAVKDIIAIQQTKIEQSPPTEIQARSEPISADIVEGAMAKTSEPITSKSIAKNLLSTEKTIKETEETIKETNGIALRMQIHDELPTINKDVKKEDKTAIQAVQKSILYFSGKAEIISSEHRIELVQQYEVACKKYPGIMAKFDKLMRIKFPKSSPITKQAKPTKIPLTALNERMAKRQRKAKGHKTALDKAAMGEVIPRPKTQTRQGG